MYKVDCVFCGHHFDTDKPMGQLTRCPNCNKPNEVQQTKVNLKSKKKMAAERKKASVNSDSKKSEYIVPNMSYKKGQTMREEQFAKDILQIQTSDEWSTSILLLMPVIFSMGLVYVINCVPLLFVQSVATAVALITVISTALAVSAKEKQPYIGLGFLLIWVFIYPYYIWSEMPKYKWFAISSTVLSAVLYIYVIYTANSKMAEISASFNF